jgi:GT2 family glycosyltransferase
MTFGSQGMQNTSKELSANRNTQPLVLIVTLNWNDHERTAEAVKSVLKMDYLNFRVLIVENGSTDGSAVALRQIADNRVELLESAVNKGYTGGCNLGLARALELGAEYVWLLNNDALAPPGTLSSLIMLAQSDSRIGLATPIIASLDEVPRVTFAGGICDMNAARYNETNNIAVAQKWAEEHPAAGLVIGTAMLIRTDLIHKIGMLDESFFTYYEDIDYSVRSLKAGYRNVVDWSSVVYHLEKDRETNPLGMMPHYWYYNARNARRFWRKHLGLWKSLGNSWESFNIFLRQRNRCKSNPVACNAILAGLWHGWLNKSGPYNHVYRMPLVPAAIVTLYSRRRVLRGVDPVDERG